MQPPIDVALVGYGFSGKTFHAPFLTSTQGLRLRWVVSQYANKVHANLPDCMVGSFDQMLTDPQIRLVVIATPNDSHAPLAQRALLAGKNVVIDKPFALDAGQARALIALAKNQKRLLSVYHNRRFDGDFMTVKELLEKGTLGRISHFESHFDRFRPQVRDRWRESAGQGAGLWNDLGPHLLDQSLQLFGQPEWIQADLALQRQGAQSDDYFHVTLGYGQMRVILHASTLACANTPRFIIHGEQGSFIKWGQDSQEDMLKQGISPLSADWGKEQSPGMLSVWSHTERQEHTLLGLAGHYGRYYQAIAQALQQQGENPVPAEQALAVMVLLDLAKQSQQQGQRLCCQILSE